MTFHPDKPFRLSLYVGPKEKLTSPVKICKFNDSFSEDNKENTRVRPVKNNKNDNKSKLSRGRLKEVNVALFEDENTSKKKQTRSVMEKIQKPNQEDDCNKENEEYKKWLQNITSEFEDVDKFELSISYDDL